MNAYSEDLRKKIVEALRRGMTKSGAARTFSVSRSSVKRYAKLAGPGRFFGARERPCSKPKDKRARRLLEAVMEECPAPTLSERREYLGRVAALSLSESTVSYGALGGAERKFNGSVRARRGPESSLEDAGRRAHRCEAAGVHG